MIYYLEADPAVWLLPLLEILGLLCQLLSTTLKSLWLLALGLLLLLAGALPDRDLSLITADLLALFGLYYILFYKK